MTEEVEKKLVWIDAVWHKILKVRAAENETEIYVELDKILEKNLKN